MPIMMSMSETVRRVSCFPFERSLIIRSSAINWMAILAERDGLLRASSDEIRVRINSRQKALV